MPAPNVKLISLSNVYTRLMHFAKKGDIEEGHKHNFDHATLISSGSILYEVLDDNGINAISSKVFTSPDLIFVNKDKFHRLTALEDNTVCGCIHALRVVGEDIISPDSFIEPYRDTHGVINAEVKKRTKKDMVYFTSELNPNNQQIR